MNTNDLQTITQLANAHGWNLTAGQISTLAAMGAVAVRWLQHETRAAVQAWTNIGGFTGLKNWIVNGGKSKPISTAISPDTTKKDAQ